MTSKETPVLTCTGIGVLKAFSLSYCCSEGVLSCLLQGAHQMFQTQWRSAAVRGLKDRWTLANCQVTFC